MAFSLGSIATKLDSIVSDAASFADLADNYAKEANLFTRGIPVIGPDVETAVTLIDDVNKALAALKGFLDGLA